MASDKDLLAEFDALPIESPAPRPQLSVVEGLQGDLRSILAGPTFNFGDEIEAALYSALGPNTYAEEKALIDAQQAKYRAANPVVAGLFEIGSGIALNPLGAVGQGAGRGQAATRLATAAPVQGALAGAGAAEEGERKSGAVTGGIIGTVGSIIGDVAGNLFRAAGDAGDNLKLSAFGIKASDITKSLKRGGKDATKGKVAQIETPLIDTVRKAEAAGIIKAGEDSIVNASNVITAQDDLASRMRNILAQADSVVPPQKFFGSTHAGKYIKSQPGTAQDAAVDLWKKEVASMFEKMPNGGTLEELQALKVQLNKTWDVNPQRQDLLKAIRADVREEIERRVDEAAGAGLIPTEYQGAVKTINKEWGDLAELKDVLTRRIGADHGTDIVQEFYMTLNTTGPKAVGSMGISSAASGSPVPAAIGATLTALRGAEKKSALADQFDLFSPITRRVGTALLGDERAGVPALATALSTVQAKEALTRDVPLKIAADGSASYGGVPVIQADQATIDQLLADFDSLPEQKKKMKSAEIESLIQETALAEGLDPKFLRSWVVQESGLNPAAKSNKGAAGLLQLMPETAKEVASKLGLEDYDVYDPKTSLALGIAYYKGLLERFGDPALALTAYHSGPGTVSRLLADAKSKDLAGIKAGLGPIGKLYATQILNRAKT